MLNLKSVILEIKVRDYQRFVAGLEENNANNYLFLLKAYRNSVDQPQTDEEIREKMGLTATAFHTMKSRLYDKVQDFLFQNFEGLHVDLRKKLDSLPRLIYSDRYHPHIAIAILEHMVHVLEENDMPHDLIKVYDALRRMHLHAPKFFDYTRAYNRQMAYALALDKAQGIALELSRKIGEYDLSHDDETWELILTLRQEINNISGLYSSHRLRFQSHIAHLSVALLTPADDGMDASSHSIEDHLAMARKLIHQHPDDPFYASCKPLMDYLSFEFYLKYHMHKKAQTYYDLVCQDIPGMLRLAPLCASSHFFTSKTTYFKEIKRLPEMAADVQLLEESGFDASLLDHVSYAHYMIHKAATAFFVGKYRKAVKHLNRLQQDVMFKNMVHAEIEVKVFLILCHSMSRNFPEAKDQIKSLSTKLRNHNLTKRYQHVISLMKFFRIAIKRSMVKTRYSTIKLAEYRDTFIRQNTGRDQILPFISWQDDGIIRRISSRPEEWAEKW